jgi:hypothetical protein
VLSCGFCLWVRGLRWRVMLHPSIRWGFITFPSDWTRSINPGLLGDPRRCDWSSRTSAVSASICMIHGWWGRMWGPVSVILVYISVWDEVLVCVEASAHFVWFVVLMVVDWLIVVDVWFKMSTPWDGWRTMEAYDYCPVFFPGSSRCFQASG